MSGKASRAKGQRGEREALKALGDELGAILTRNLQQTREGGADCLQVKGFAIEIKRKESLARPTWWRQACDQAERVGAEPMVLYRRNREQWQALIHIGNGDYRLGNLIEAAEVIREKWLAWP